ncbi:unnamed protein product [Caenorhabditis brenneri]
MKIPIYLLFTSLFVIFDVANGSAGIPDDLHKEFHDLASSRLKSILNHVAFGQSTSLKMTFIVVDCQFAPFDAQIEQTVRGELILKEVTCGTVGMHKWCNEQPGRSGVLMVGNKKMNGTVLTRFLCDADPIRKPIDEAQLKAQQHRFEVFMNISLPLCFIAIAVAWYVKIKAPFPIHPSQILNLNNKSPHDSFENITLESSKASPYKSLSFNSFRSYFISVPKKFRIIV